MANYLARDGLHLDNVNNTPPIYGSVSLGYNSPSGGTYLCFDITDDNLNFYVDRVYINSFSIRRA